MAYHLVKLCKRCGSDFEAGSNRQQYCETCKKPAKDEKRSAWDSKHYQKSREEKLEKTRAYNKSEKGRAAQKLRDAVRRGDIVRGKCEVCGEEKAQGHHPDYSKPLEVRWLCARHHREEHLFKPWQNQLRRAGYDGGFSLGQLIEACGDKFGGVVRMMEGEWQAYGGDLEGGHNGGWEHILNWNPTPEEAVAHLWLALHS